MKEEITENKASGKDAGIKKTFYDDLWKMLLGYCIIVLFVIILFKTVLMISYVPSESMESTIMTGDIVLSTRSVHETGDVSRYDILLFKSTTDEKTIYIKRVIGLPGETIEVKDGEVYADGVKLDKSFTNGPQNRNGDGVWEVPENHLFFMGDNRNNSADSRYWGGDAAFVPIENVISKAKTIILPLSHFENIEYKQK